MARVIYTLTPNPAIDLNVSCARLIPNGVSRTTDAVYTPNGKGLNVSFTLGHFGCPTRILGFFGGFTGRFIVDGAEGMGVGVTPVWVDGITRVNTFITMTDGTGTEYKFPNAGCPVSREKQLEMLDLLRRLPDLDCLVVSGSLSPQMETTFFDEVAEVVAELGADLVFDISTGHLAEMSSYKPLLIKPNDEELLDIFGIDVNAGEGVVPALLELCSRGIQNVLLTMGGEGAYFCDGTHVWQANAPKVDFMSSACAGDACLGSFLSLWFENRDAVEAALVRAMATGADVAGSAGLGTFGRVDELSKQVVVTRLA